MTILELTHLYTSCAAVLFLATALFLTIKTHCIQIRGFGRFWRLIAHGVPKKQVASAQERATMMGPIQALFTAMGTTIGMGNMVGPTIAIMTGGPGALLWLVIYIFLSSALKYAEVVFALRTRVTTPDGHVVGGPMYYLRAVHPFLAQWYTAVMVLLFAGWSSIQSNTLATIFALEGAVPWMVGAGLALIMLLVIGGGARRVGAVASTLVPCMFLCYLVVACIILSKDPSALWRAIREVVSAALKPQAPIAGFMGVTFMQTLRAGVYRGIHITESGLGSSSIPHAVASVQHPTDQGILALFSGIADSLLCSISGLLVLVTGVWMTGTFRSTLIYEVFKLHAPAGGSLILLATIVLFVLTTIIGNSFNGMQLMTSVASHRVVQVYVLVSAFIIFGGALMQAPVVWQFMDVLMACAAIPNLIGLIVLSVRYKEWLKR